MSLIWPQNLSFKKPKAAPDPRSPGIVALSLRQRQIMAQALDQKQQSHQKPAASAA
jgi:hypothetical protein